MDLLTWPWWIWMKLTVTNQQPTPTKYKQCALLWCFGTGDEICIFVLVMHVTQLVMWPAISTCPRSASAEVPEPTYSVLKFCFFFSDKCPMNCSPMVSLQRASNAENIPNMLSSRCITNVSPLHYLQIVGQTSTINAAVRQYYSQAISQSANKPDMSFANDRVVFWQVFAEATNLIYHLHPQKGLNFVICMNSIVSRVSFSMMSWHT